MLLSADILESDRVRVAPVAAFVVDEEARAAAYRGRRDEGPRLEDAHLRRRDRSSGETRVRRQSTIPGATSGRRAPETTLGSRRNAPRRRSSREQRRRSRCSGRRTSTTHSPLERRIHGSTPRDRRRRPTEAPSLPATTPKGRVTRVTWRLKGVAKTDSRAQAAAPRASSRRHRRRNPPKGSNASLTASPKHDSDSSPPLSSSQGSPSGSDRPVTCDPPPWRT